MDHSDYHVAGRRPGLSVLPPLAARLQVLGPSPDRQARRGHPRPGGTEDRSSYDSTFNVHALLLRSPTIAAKALENHGLRSLPTFAKSQDPLAAIAGGLTVDCKGGGSTSVATLTFKCGSRRRLP